MIKLLKHKENGKYLVIDTEQSYTVEFAPDQEKAARQEYIRRKRNAQKRMKVKLDNGKTITVQCHQYMNGLYIYIYDEDGRVIDQSCLSQNKEEFINAVKNNKIFKGQYVYVKE